MSAAAPAYEPIIAPESERQDIARIGEALERAPAELKKKPARARIIGPDDEQMIIPDSLYVVLLEATRQLAAGKGITIAPVTAELTTQQAADLLNVSRPFVVKLLEEGALPYHKVGTHRRVYLQDLLTYKRRRDAESREALAHLINDAQELGIYDT